MVPEWARDSNVSSGVACWHLSPSTPGSFGRCACAQ